MNREIKFRAWSRTGDWDEEGETQQFEMISADNLAFYTSDLLKNQLRDIDDDFYVMQFIGLKDKNGKEIYEGDVVRYTTPHLDHPRDFKIVFNDGMFCQIELSPRGYVDEGEEAGMWIDWEDITIIGNIYENPELLKTRDL